MSDLIDREALRREIYKDMAIEDNKRVVQLLQAIMDAPTIDAVPVVRCKDCVGVTRWGSELICSRISDVMDGYYHGTVEIVKPDDYCSQGIRKSCAKMDGGAGE